MNIFFLHIGQEETGGYMKTVTQHELQHHLFQILKMVQQGEEIMIEDEQHVEPAVVIVSYHAYQSKQKRPLGLLKGKACYRVKDDFKITDEELLTV